MDEEQRAARRKALADQIAQMKKQGGPSSVAPPEPVEEEDDLDWDIEPGADSVAAAGSDTDIDSGWDDEKDKEEELAIEKAELELPDEKFDPVAYAAAKKSIEERKAARRDKKRAKDAAKKARREARAREAKAKQKGKKPKPRIVQTAKTPPAKTKSKPVSKSVSREPELEDETSEEIEARADAKPAKRRLSSTSLWTFGIIVAVFIAAIAYAAMHAR